MDTNISKKAQYNRAQKKYGKIAPEHVSDNDLEEYIDYMRQRISHIEFYAQRALKKTDNADSLIVGRHFVKRAEEMKKMLIAAENRYENIQYNEFYIEDKKGQITFNIQMFMPKA